jgi:hypothetical protein
MFLDPNSVQDVPSSTSRGSGFYDYVITDIGDLIRNLSQALETGSAKHDERAAGAPGAASHTLSFRLAFANAQHEIPI